MLAFLKQKILQVYTSLGYTIKKIHQIPAPGWQFISHIPIQTVIDIGANEGQFATHIRTLFPQATLFCFEPLPHPYNILNMWAQQQKSPTHTFNVALGNHTDQSSQMYYHTQHDSSSSFLNRTSLTTTLYPMTSQQEKITVPITTLDSVMEKEHLKSPLLIKVDVQGFEKYVLEGGKKTFSKATLVILEASLDTLYEKQTTFEQLVSYMSDLGFYYAGNIEQIYAPDGHVIYIDCLFQKNYATELSER